ncbi:MAG: winged helix-turn-helix domain-containing protein [Actinomycetota bacterium]
MRRILFLTDRAPNEVLPAAVALGADLKVEPPVPDSLSRLPDVVPDVLVVDAGPDAGRAFELLSVLRAAGSPIGVLVVLPRGATDSQPWEEVADDFVHPDASEGEVRLRLAMLRVRRGEVGEAVVRLGPVAINVETYQVTVGGQPLDLTYKEFELLRYLAEHAGRVYTRAKLLQEVWGYDFYGGTRTVDVHIRRLRAKLGPAHEHLIETVRGVGYRAAEAT